MIIDDEEHIRSSLVGFLEDFEEFDLRSAHSAEEALEQLRREPADVCVVDIRLPAMNGAEFIRASTDFRRYIDIGELGLCEEDVFQKPCDGVAILERIRRVVRTG
jgi:two-component system response regulator ResD